MRRGSLLLLWWLAAAAPAAAAPLPDSLAGRPLATVDWFGVRAGDGEALSRASGWRTGARLDEALWRSLSDRVAAYYAELGHLAATVDEVGLEPAGVGLAARIAVVEGPRHGLASVIVRGAAALSAGEIVAELGLEPGRAWSSADFEAGVARVLERYRRRARPFAQLRLRALEVVGDSARVEIVVVEGDTVRVDSVAVEGLRQTRASVARRALGTLENAPFDAERAAAARQRLADLGVFARVEGPRFEMTAPGRGRLVYSVREAAANSFEGVFGYQGEGRPLVGRARLWIGNLAGTARQAAIAWQGRGAGSSEFRFHYREPFVFGLPLAAGARLAHELFDTLFTRTDFAVEATLPLGGESAATLALESGRVVVAEGLVRRSSRQGTRLTLRRRGGPAPQAADRAREFGYRAELSAEQIFERERLRPEGERKGRLSTVGLDGASEWPWGRAAFVHLELESRLRLATRRPIPLYHLYPIGGAGSLRGYREEAFRASRLALARLEVGRAAGGARWFAFLDQGVFHREREAGSTTGPETRYRAGYGVGAALPTALGRVGVDFGWGRGDGPLDAKLHLRLDSAF